MRLVQTIREAAADALRHLYGADISADQITINATKPEFEGEYTIVLFTLVKKLGKSPDALGNEVGAYLSSQNPLFTGFNVIKGFLNLSVSHSYFEDFLNERYSFSPGKNVADRGNVIVEYSSPNTNKPLHLGHLRNNFLGWSVARILEDTGHSVFKTCIVNDRGIHICKSMIAWQLFGNGDTPQSTGVKGDHFVGDYYVRCENRIREEYAVLDATVRDGDYSGIAEKDRQKLREMNELMAAIVGDSDRDKEKLKKLSEDRKELIRSSTPVMRAAQEMLLKWEAGDEEVLSLWRKMNGWVYEGFQQTYDLIGTSFDKIYYESNTYLLGKEFVEEGLASGIFFRKDDGSVWVDLTAEGLDEKLLLRKDGTSVYITQDLGLADEKYKDFRYQKSLYVIADEQNYHMKVLQLVLKKLGRPYADGVIHMSYGMVELPSGRMKSREGTVVDADDLVAEMVAVAAKKTEELGKVKDFSADELDSLHRMLGLGALKFYLLRVDPKKKMIFNPEESIDLHGFTGPFVQYTHARICSILRKEQPQAAVRAGDGTLLKLEKELIFLLEQFDTIMEQAAAEYNPSLIAIYVFQVAKTYNTFYAEHSVLKAESAEKKELRLRICMLTASVIRRGMNSLGIEVPERM